MAKGRPLDVEHELLEVFKQNGLVNEYLITVVPPALWRINPPVGRGRSIAKAQRLNKRSGRYISRLRISHACSTLRLRLVRPE